MKIPAVVLGFLVVAASSFSEESLVEDLLALEPVRTWKVLQYTDDSNELVAYALVTGRDGGIARLALPNAEDETFFFTFQGPTIDTSNGPKLVVQVDEREAHSFDRATFATSVAAAAVDDVNARLIDEIRGGTDLTVRVTPIGAAGLVTYRFTLNGASEAIDTLRSIHAMQRARRE